MGAGSSMLPSTNPEDPNLSFNPSGNMLSGSGFAPTPAPVAPTLGGGMPSFPSTENLKILREEMDDNSFIRGGGGHQRIPRSTSLSRHQALMKSLRSPNKSKETNS